MSFQEIETLVALAIGVLATVFIGALIVLIFICRRSNPYYKSKQCSLDKHNELRPDVHLIETELPDMELGEVRLNPELEQIFTADEQWIDDATGLVPHCLAVLKICHTLTERLIAVAIGPLQIKESSIEIIEIAKRISLRVDDVVRSMYPPLDTRLLEARAAALALAVTHLALVTRYSCDPRQRQLLTWIDKGIGEMDSHLMVLREAALAHEASCRIQNFMNLSINTDL